MQAIPMTLRGAEKLREELDFLKSVRRPEIIAAIAEAREHGDLKENAEYHAAREELSFIDGRIDEIETLLKQVVVIKESKGKNSSKSIIQLGSNVKLKVDGKDEHYMLVGEWEADPIERKISHESPLGRALIGRAVGESIEVQAPSGKIIYKILSIS